MHSNKFLNQYAAEEVSFQRANLSEIPSHQAPESNTPLKEIGSNGGLLFVSTSCFVLALALVCLKRLDFQKRLGGRFTAIKHFYQIPCANCQYFQNNPYLKCAVHPAKALSQEAVNCPDYKPHDEKPTH